MTYLVLARKWRPRSFDTLIGQDHVVRALTHALATGRLHHAWLFTGTRGVGKTTLSRLLAKSLNCETGITAAPCGVCRACTEIDTGRFVDYLELDAASNRGVDEMTQLLEQAVYSPSVGRFKVYMIDEVHMLTGHAFNAMLKTLEEPPPHVKFILATTDPQKIPVTVLSRCLQFNLKQMTADAIVSHLEDVLGQEEISYETPALRLIARAASGSMRDALSLADQAIAYSAANLSADAIQTMLGTIDQRHLARLLQALSAASSTEVLHVADELAARGLSYSGALADLAVLLSRIAIEQRVAGTVPDDDPMAADIADLARTMHPDLVQLFYSVAVHSRHELSLAPDEYAGFVMACLRMLALAPSTDSGSDKTAGAAQEAAAAPAAVQAASPSVASSPEPVEERGGHGDVAAWEDDLRSDADFARTDAVSGGQAARQHGTDPDPSSGINDAQPYSVANDRDADDRDANDRDANDRDANDNDAGDVDAGDVDASAANIDDPRGSDSADYSIDPSSGRDIGALVDDIVAPDRDPSPVKARAPRPRDMTAGNWPALASQLPVTGLAAELARQSEWLGFHKDTVMLRVAVRTLAESPGKSRLCTVLSEHFGKVVQLDVEYGVTGDETAHAHEQARRALTQQEAERAARADPFVLTLINEFGARLIPDSVRPGPDQASMAETA